MESLNYAFFDVSGKEAENGMKAELDGIISGLSEYLDKVQDEEKKHKHEKQQQQQHAAELMQELEGLRRE